MKSNLSFARPLAAVLGATALMAAIPAFAADVISQEPPAPVAPRPRLRRLGRRPA